MEADPARYGLTGDIVAKLASAREAFAAAYAVTSVPAVRTMSGVALKNEARRALEAVIRPVVRSVRAVTSLRPDELFHVALRPREPKRRRVPPPTESPRITLTPIDGCTLRVDLRGTDTLRRGKPIGVAAATIFSHIGEAAPADRWQWSAARTTTTPRGSVPLPLGSPPGTRVWVSACWLSPTAQPGPMSSPMHTYLMGGVRLSVAA